MAALARLTREQWRELAWVTLGHAGAALGALAGTALLTRLLTPASYGVLALGLAVAVVPQQVLFGPLAGACLRFYPVAAECGQRGALLDCAWSLLFRALGLATAMAGLAAALVFLAVPGLPPLVIAAALLFALAGGVNGVLDAFQTAARQRAVAARHQAVSQWLRYLAAAALVAAAGEDGTAALFGLGLGMALALAWQGFDFDHLIRRPARTEAGSSPPRRDWSSDLLGYGWPVAAWGILTGAHLMSDRWVLGSVTDLATVGRYAVLYQIGYLPVVLAFAILTRFVAPLLFAQAGGGESEERLAAAVGAGNRLVAGGLGVTFLGAAAAALVHRPLFQLLFAPAYESVSALLPFMVLWCGLFESGQLLSLGFMSRLTTRALLPIKLGSAGLGILLNVAGAWVAGLEGLIAGGVATALFYLAWLAVISRRGGTRCSEAG